MKKTDGSVIPNANIVFIAHGHQNVNNMYACANKCLAAPVAGSPACTGF